MRGTSLPSVASNTFAIFVARESNEWLDCFEWKRKGIRRSQLGRDKSDAYRRRDRHRLGGERGEPSATEMLRWVTSKPAIGECELRNVIGGEIVGSLHGTERWEGINQSLRTVMEVVSSVYII